jgi:hypothetical protein
VGDLDGDGRPEIVVLNMNATPSVLKNTGSAGRGLNLKLTGTQSNRSAIGARVTAVAGGRKMIDEVMSGGSYYSHNSFTLHFGLGTVDASRPHRGKVAQRPYRGMASCGRRPDRQDCRGRQRARKRNPVELLSPDVFSRSRTHENVLPGQQ